LIEIQEVKFYIKTYIDLVKKYNISKEETV